MTKKQIIAIADKAHGDGLVGYAHEQGVQCGDSLAEFIAIELSETYEPRKPAVRQLEHAYNKMYCARRELEAVERAFRDAIDELAKKQKDSKEKV